MKHLKEEFDKLTLKEAVIMCLAITCMLSAIVLIFLACYLEPQGEIHTSVLTYFGLSSAFCASCLGISLHYSNELSKLKAEIMNLLPNVQQINTQQNDYNQKGEQGLGCQGPAA